MEENLIELEEKSYDAYNLAQDDAFGYPCNLQYQQFSSVVADWSILGSICCHVEEQESSEHVLVPESKSSSLFCKSSVYRLLWLRQLIKNVAAVKIMPSISAIVFSDKSPPAAVPILAV